MFYHYASNSHLAGTPNDHELAKWTLNKFTEFGLKNASIDTYHPYINYPIERKLAIVSGPQDLLYKASLRETNERDSSPTFHGKMKRLFYKKKKSNQLNISLLR